MAESIVSGLLEKLASSIIHEFGLALNAKNDMRKLETTFQAIKCVLEDAESQSMKDKSLFNWLAKLEDATYDMEDLLDYVEMETERRKLEIHGHMIKMIRQTGHIGWMIAEAENPLFLQAPWAPKVFLSSFGAFGFMGNPRNPSRGFGDGGLGAAESSLSIFSGLCVFGVGIA